MANASCLWWDLDIAFLPFEDGIPYTTLPDGDSDSRELAKFEIIGFVSRFAFQPLGADTHLAHFMQGVCNAQLLDAEVTTYEGKEYTFAGDIRIDDLPWRRRVAHELAFFLPRDQQGPIIVVRQHKDVTKPLSGSPDVLPID